MVFFGLAPWFWYAIDNGRTMFYFYAAPAVPFLVLAVVYVLGAIMYPAGRPAALATPETARRLADRRLIGGVIAGAYLVLVVLCFGYFFKVFVGDVMPYADWSARMWLGSRWI